MTTTSNGKKKQKRKAQMKAKIQLYVRNKEQNHLFLR